MPELRASVWHRQAGSGGLDLALLRAMRRLGRMRLAQNDAHGVPSDQEFFVSGDGVGEQFGICRGDRAFASHGLLIFVRVQMEAGPLHPGTDARPDIW